MAAGGIKKKERAPPTGEQNRARLQSKLQHETEKQLKEDNKEAQQLIILLQDTLAKSNEELRALTADDLEKMDIDDDGAGDHDAADETGGSQGGDKAHEAGESDDADSEKPIKSEQSKMSKKPEIERENSKNGSKKPKKVKILDSVEDEGGSSPLFVSQNDRNPDSDAESTGYVDPELGEMLISRPGSRCSGSRPVAWQGVVGRSPKAYINMYGQRSHARYRLQKSCADPKYKRNPPEGECWSSTNNTLGEARSEDGISLKYGIDDILGVIGVAVACVGRSPSRDDVEAINPKFISKWRGIETRLLIVWMVGGTEEKPVVKKAWETRSTLRRRWGKDTDQNIYDAAVTAEDRYEYGQTEAGRTIAASRSPSVDLLTKQSRKKAPGIRPSPTPGAKAQAPASSGEVKDLMESFIASFMELLSFEEGKDYTSFKQLNPQQTRNCIQAWKLEKAEAGLA